MSSSAAEHDFLRAGHDREAVVWFPTGPALTRSIIVDEDEDFFAFCEGQRDFWSDLITSVDALRQAGWHIGARLGFGYAIAPKDQSLAAISDEVAATVSEGTPIEFRTEAFCCGGCFAGESPDVPEPFPAWLAANRVGKAVRVERLEDLGDQLIELGMKGIMNRAEVEAAAKDGNWLEPGFIEEFAGLGPVDLISEAWVRWVGRVDARVGHPQTGMNLGGWSNPIRSIVGIAEVWLAGAREESEELSDRFSEIVDLAREAEQRAKDLKVPLSVEQAVENLLSDRRPDDPRGE
ncbi:MAG: hypothetical protein J0H98_10695 [Solirubrobacterales bacterium]|nr:hypothetical protein [Solirubrobacterales bacterium]